MERHGIQFRDDHAGKEGLSKALGVGDMLTAVSQGS